MCLSASLGSPALAAADNDASAGAAVQPTLLGLWFELQPLGAVSWPYAFIRHRETSATQNDRKQVLTEELDNLIWRLQAAGYSALADALTEWRQRIAVTDDFRTPGRWGPAALMANPRNSPPLSAVAAIGACRVPAWVEIWDGRGIRRIAWTPGMRLSTLLDDNGALQSTAADTVALVTPFGEIHRRGIAAWNYRDAPISPGTRIVVPLPLDGQASVWINDRLTGFLSHLVPGDQCRQLTLNHESAHE